MSSQQNNNIKVKYEQTDYINTDFQQVPNIFLDNFINSGEDSIVYRVFGAYQVNVLVV